jgi:predicted RNase H-like HicB family nuclease
MNDVKRAEDRTMRFYTFDVIIEKEPGEQGYSAYTPTLAGCFCRAKTLDEARRSIQTAIQAEVASLLADERTIGQSERVVHVAELTVAVPEADQTGPVIDRHLAREVCTLPERARRRVK